MQHGPNLASPRQMGWSGCRDARSCVSTKAHPEKRIIAGDLASHSLYIVMRHLGVIMSLLQGPPRSNRGEAEEHPPPICHCEERHCAFRASSLRNTMIEHQPNIPVLASLCFMRSFYHTQYSASQELFVKFMPIWC